jgi:hypothetical protein
MTRRLRIAVSVFFAVLTVLVCVLWVRSYWVTDLVSRIDSRSIATTIGSQYGTVYFAHFDAAIGYKGSGNSAAPREWAYKSVGGYTSSDGLFVWKRDSNSLHVAVAHWLIAIGAIMGGAVPWLPFRFSLRTLFIAATLAAVVLGLIMWLAR